MHARTPGLATINREMTEVDEQWRFPVRASPACGACVEGVGLKVWYVLYCFWGFCENADHLLPWRMITKPHAVTDRYFCMELQISFGKMFHGRSRVHTSVPPRTTVR
ncbi:unnamed protein product [Ectocarpus sp. 12 AP-2014]